MKTTMTLPLLFGLILVPGLSPADVLLLDAIHEAPMNSAEGIPRPNRGMSMEQVKREYGEPSLMHPQVGDPPITRWDYSDYSVFFEYQHVLTAVVHQ